MILNVHNNSALEIFQFTATIWAFMKEGMSSTFLSFAYLGFWINIEAQEFNPVTRRRSDRKGERGWEE